MSSEIRASRLPPFFDINILQSYSCKLANKCSRISCCRIVIWNVLIFQPRPYEVSPSAQHWVVVGCLMPISIALYLLLITVCYYLFCKRPPGANGDQSGQQARLGRNSRCCLGKI